MELKIEVGDITRLAVDAIVNAANERLAPGAGVCGAIHQAAGPKLAEECARIAPCPTGHAAITAGFDLSARFVIHAVGPIYRDGQRGEPELLAGCYRRSLELAHRRGLDSIAFPCISTGVYGYPMDRAATVALGVVRDWLTERRSPQRVILCCFREDDAGVYRRLLRREAAP
jgi:O-acetyl-ADP-ribose deacetylase (regulator of RNase III)